MTTFWANITPEEKKAFLEKRNKIVREKRIAEAEAKLKKEEAERIKKELMLQKVGGPKEQIQVKKIKNELFKMGDTAYLPSWDALNVAISLSKDGKDLEAIRLECFPHVAQDVWNKFKKAMFATQISSPEDVGNELLDLR